VFERNTRKVDQHDLIVESGPVERGKVTAYQAEIRGFAKIRTAAIEGLLEARAAEIGFTTLNLEMSLTQERLALAANATKTCRFLEDCSVANQIFLENGVRSVLVSGDKVAVESTVRKVDRLFEGAVAQVHLALKVATLDVQGNLDGAVTEIELA
jgi:hypothetical protein